MPISLLQEQINKFINRALSNPHTSIAGMAWIACKLGKIWMPKLQAQFEATETFIVGYGFFAASDSNGKITPAQLVETKKQE